MRDFNFNLYRFTHSSMIPYEVFNIPVPIYVFKRVPTCGTIILYLYRFALLLLRYGFACSNLICTNLRYMEIRWNHL